MHKFAKIVAVAAAALTVSACGRANDAAGSTSSAPLRSMTAPLSAPPPPSTQRAGRECITDDVRTTGKFGENPTITIPDSCDPPKKLISKDLSAGAGPEAKAGNALEMNYSLVAWSDKQKLDSSFDRGNTFSLSLGAGAVIKGWDQGLVGIKQGGRRLLIIPPDLAYDQGRKGIKPNETLVFVVDAVKVSSASAT